MTQKVSSSYLPPKTMEEKRKAQEAQNLDVISATTKDYTNSVYSRLLESVKKCKNKKLLNRIKN